MKRVLATVFAFLAAAGSVPAQQTPDSPLRLEARIPLGTVKGRIDHLAVDLARERLFIAELGNDSVGVVDLKARKVAHRLDGLKEPQGVGYVPSTDTLYVANGGDGSVRLFRGEALMPSVRIDLGGDADNIRLDGDKVLVGYGSGAIAVIDASSLSKIAEMPLKGHPESFQLGASAGAIFVNVPSARTVEVLDRSTGQVRASWPTRGASGNYAMALNGSAQHVIVAFRNPARLVAFAMSDGAIVAERETCGDSDDLFFDAKRSQVYVICGAGFIDVFDAGVYRRIARIPTVSGARTGLFIPALDLLAVAVRASGKEGAAVWLYRPGS
jgi:DNA-binding beta-propeller fold protein YncE